MCIRRFVLILVSCCLLGPLFHAAGCAAVDAFARDVNDVGTAARQEARDPASPLPIEARTTLELFGLAATASYGLYQRFRYGGLKKTAKAIVQGVEDSEPQIAAAVKEKIERRMIQADDYVKSNARVDELKK